MFMLPAILRNFFSPKATRPYPFKAREPFTRARGELVNKIEDCVFCSTCARKCPSQCIRVDKEAGTWVCDPYACVYCGICVDSCPTHCLSQKTLHRAPVRAKAKYALKGEPPKRKKKAEKTETE